MSWLEPPLLWHVLFMRGLIVFLLYLCIIVASFYSLVWFLQPFEKNCKWRCCTNALTKDDVQWASHDFSTFFNKKKIQECKVCTYKTRIQQTKMLVTCQRFGDLFLGGLIWQYSSNRKTYNKGRFKVIGTYLQQ